MSLITRTKQAMLLASVLLIATSWIQTHSLLENLIKQKQQIEKDVLLALPKANYLGNYSYQGQTLSVKSYPAYFFNGSASTLRKEFDISDHLSLDTTSAYAAIYVNNSLKLEGRKSKSKYYSFYPIAPLAEDNYQGLGSRKITDYDVVLQQAASSQSKTAFFLNFSALENAWSIPPTIMAFYKENKLCFIDKDAKVYESFEALVVARYGGKEQLIKALSKQEAMAKEGKVIPIN